jgi:plasmid maintenance system antidote protein VapI
MSLQRVQDVTTHQPMPPSPDRRPPRSLREYFRRENALSQRQIARRLGCNQSHVSMIASGQRAASGTVGQKLAALTGVPLENLVIKPRRHRKKVR